MVNWKANATTHKSILEAIGRTPAVELPRFSEEFGARVIAKVEYFSASGSLKDRIYLEMIEEAERAGELRPGMTVLECSTGNAGIACAFVSAVKGYPCVIVMPDGMSEERRKTIRAYGGELVLTPGGESDVDLALEKLEEMVAEAPDKYWVPRQFDNPNNITAHYKTTGPELWEQTEGTLDAFVATQGTGGTVTGIGKYLKEQNSDVKLFAAEPAECPLLARREWGPHKIEGIGDGFVPRNLDLSLLDGVVTVDSDEAIAMARRLAREEGILAGISSGANLVAVKKLVQSVSEIEVIATIINDNGQRYFSTELFGEPKDLEVPERDHPLDQYTVKELDKYQAGWTIID